MPLRLKYPWISVRRLLAGLAAICTGVSVAVLADAPASVTYTYDDAGRLIGGTFSDGKVVQYAYDPAGNRTSMNQGVPVQLSIASGSATEGSAVNLTVTKTGTALGTITVDCAQTAGSATATTDYTPSTQTLTFLVADTSKPCTVQTVQDSIYEQGHTFNAILQNATGSAVVATGSAVGTINDNDSAPVISVSGGSATEGAAVSFTITKTGSTELSHSITYATANGTALTSDSDYTAAGTTYTFTPAQTSTNVVVSTTIDGKYELNETFALNLSAPGNGATIGTGSANGTINNDDAAPSFSVNSPATVNEGGLITFTVTKGGNTNTGVSHSFNWATANNSAVSPSDYTANSGSVTFAVGESTKTIQVLSVTDGVVDSASNETFFVNLSTNGSTNGATLSGSQGTGTIADIDSAAPSVPANIRKTPTTGTGGSFTILWDASTGTVNHYTLEETVTAPSPGVTTYSVAGTSKAFSKGSVYLELSYRVRACATANETQCSAYSGSVFKLVCPTSGCE